MAKILLVEDDRILSNLVKAYLNESAHLIDVAETSTAARAQLAIHEYDLLILDWMLPDGSGVDLCRDFRAKGHGSPILFLTARQDKRDKAEGLDAGGDDYLVKPFEQVEFLARVRALLRRPRTWQGTILSVRDVEVDTQSQTVRRNGLEIKLRPREFALLEFLMRNPGRYFTGEALFNRLWKSDSEVSTETVRMHIMALRKKLGDASKNPLICSSRGLGYKFNPTSCES